MTGRWRYPAVILALVLVVIWALGLLLWTLTQRHAYALLSEEGTHLAASIQASTLHGLRRVRASQDGLLERLKMHAAWLDTVLTGNPGRDGPLIAELSQREDLDVVALYDDALRPLVWTDGLPPGRGIKPRWHAGPPREPGSASCPEACGPLIGLLAQMKRSGDKDRAFDMWRWHHGWRRTGPAPVGYARRRSFGGFVFLRASPDLTRRTLDFESFQSLLENLALTKKVRDIALTDAQGLILFATDRGRIGTAWEAPDPGARLLVVSEPFPMGTDGAGTLHIALTTEDARQILSTARRNLIVLSAAASMIGVSGLLAVFTMERRHRTRMDAMRDSLYQQERLADLGRMAAGVAHEIRNPLNSLGLMAQRLSRATGQGEGNVEELSVLMRREIARLDRTVETIVDLARAPSSTKKTVDLRDLLERVVMLYRSEAEDRGINVALDSSASVSIGADADRLHQAVGNLVRNALAAAPTGSTVAIALEMRHGFACITVKDSGAGFSEEARTKGIEAFYSTKQRGLGLGLTLARRVAQDHGGSLHVANREEGGAMVQIRLPLSHKESTQ